MGKLYFNLFSAAQAAAEMKTSNHAQLAEPFIFGLLKLWADE